MEGTLAKSPSFFLRSLEFTQEFADVEGFTFPTTLRSSAKARIIGRTLVDVVHRSYKVRLATSNETLTGAQQSMK
jgi:hypothetical protein